MARSRRTPAMLVGRCSSQLSSHKLQAKSKKSQAPSEADLSRRAVEGSAVPRTFPGNVFRPTIAEIEKANYEPLSEAPFTDAHLRRRPLGGWSADSHPFPRKPGTHGLSGLDRRSKMAFHLALQRRNQIRPILAQRRPGLFPKA